MIRLRSLSPELESLLEAHRPVPPLPPSVEARALSRAASLAAKVPAPPSMPTARVRRWAFAAGASLALAVVAAGAYAARAWWGPVASLAPRRPGLVAARSASGASGAGAVGAEGRFASGELGLGPSEPMPGPPRLSAGAGWFAGGSEPVRGFRGSRFADRRPSNAELEILLRARQAVGREDFPAALAAIAEHVRRFPAGILSEEREALRVRSLAALGRQDEAQRAASAFHARFPRSVLLSTLARLTDTAP